MRTIVDDSVNGMDKARAAYAYVRDHFTNTGRNVIADDDQSLKDIFKSHKGSVAEINLLLTAMLREEGLTADAVILSTRDNGGVRSELSDHGKFQLCGGAAQGRAMLPITWMHPNPGWDLDICRWNVITGMRGWFRRSRTVS
jgi:hypothetical protein